MARATAARPRRTEPDEQQQEQEQEQPPMAQPVAAAAEPAPKKEHVLQEREPGAGDHARKVRDSRELLRQPVPTGMRLFEAPDGYVMLCEAEQQSAWYREGNNGKGCWIKPCRTGKEQ